MNRPYSLARSLLTAGIACAVFGGCPKAEEPPCTEFEEVFVWEDIDGDGFGRDEPIGYVCTPAANQATNNADCDDDAPTVFPDAEEICDKLDNNCNNAVDEDQPKLRWYHDADGDGFGTGGDVVLECVPPDATWILQAGDCDDDDMNINPLILEICDDIDNDCDGLTDDEDGGVEPTTTTRWYDDKDNDTYGDPLSFVDRCVAPAGYLLDSSDCDDTLSTVKPTGIEICNDRDDDCDILIDDADDSIDPTTQVQLYGDTDGDGYGDVNASVLVCKPTIGVGVLDASDCDDTDPNANIDQNWYADADGDGYGSEPVVVFQCLNPGGGLVPLETELDCNDADETIHPYNTDICNDTVDADCSGSAECGSCKDWRTALGEDAVSGVYSITPALVSVADVYCDMETDGGGWTLVASSLTTLNDAGTYTAYTDLQTLEPTGFSVDVWAGMRPWLWLKSEARSDIRFTCKNDLTGDFDVDLSFYDAIWYYEITFGSDFQSCFNEQQGDGADFPPARTNNLTGDTLPAGDQWNTGYLEGEDYCGDTNDFSIDFDDRGIGSISGDGTDWGEDAALPKCGTTSGEAFFIFIRE